MEIEQFLEATQHLRDPKRAKQGKHVYSEKELRETHAWTTRKKEIITFHGFSELVEKIKNGENLNQQQLNNLENYILERAGTLEFHASHAKNVARELREAIKLLRK